MPSTILNIWDILQNWKSVTKMNEDISWLYICYQVKTQCCITMQMKCLYLLDNLLQFGIMVGTFIGPAGIYMAIAGGVNQVREY